MSDMQMPPMGGAMGGGASGGGALADFKKNRSLAEPIDATMMAQDGTITPDMTIADFYQNVMGLDVNTNTVMDMVQATKKNIGNANPMTKMQNLSKGSAGAAPGMGQAPPPPQEPTGGLGDLVNSVR